MINQELAIDKDRTDVTGQTDYTKYIRFAKVIKVYDADTLANSTDYGKVDLQWLDTLDPVNGHISVLKPGYSMVYGCGIVCMPCINDIAACYVVQDAPPIILGFFPHSQFEAVTHGDKAGYGNIGYIRPLKAGEILIKGRSQSEIYINQSGNITINIQDGDVTSMNNTDPDQGNTEQFVNRPDGSALNNIVEVVLGEDKTHFGTDAGSGKALFSLNTSARTVGTVNITGAPGLLTYSLPIDDSREIVEISKVIILDSKDGTETVKKEITTGITLRKRYAYLPDRMNNYGATKDPCTLDFNHSFAFITLPNVAAGAITKGSILRVSYIAKTRSISIVGNDLGDLFFDARNIVMRAGGGKSYLGLFSSGAVKLGGSTTELGDDLHGSIKLDQSGVDLSAGVNGYADVATISAENNIAKFGYRYYFYITDDLPLYYYDAVNRTYNICTADDYERLSSYDKINLKQRNLDPRGNPDGFTQDTVDTLLNQYISDGNGAPMTYAELKVL